MPITLDPDLDPALFPLAWILGSWRGEGAVELPRDADTPEDAPSGRRIEQEVEAVALPGGTLGWTMRTWVLDAPPPVPPTAVFSEDAAEPAPPAPSDGPEPEKRLLLEEAGTWEVLGPVEGQDIGAAKVAKPGSPESLISYTLRAVTSASDGTAEVSLGEVRGPRIQLATETVTGSGDAAVHTRATRLFGLVGGKLFWVLERAAGQEDPVPYLSAELDRV